MIHNWKGFDWEITDFTYHRDPHPQVKEYHLKPQILNHVEIIKFSEKPTYGTSLEKSRLGDHIF